jgi:hypothetical protein
MLLTHYLCLQTDSFTHAKLPARFAILGSLTEASYRTPRKRPLPTEGVKIHRGCRYLSHRRVLNTLPIYSLSSSSTSESGLRRFGGRKWLAYRDPLWAPPSLAARHKLRHVGGALPLQLPLTSCNSMHRHQIGLLDQSLHALPEGPKESLYREYPL